MSNEFRYKGMTIREWKLSFIDKWSNDAIHDLNSAFDWYQKNPHTKCCDIFARNSLERSIHAFQYATHLWNELEEN